MVKDYDPVLISLIRDSLPNLTASDLCSVQPMSKEIANAWNVILTEKGPSENELRKEGYEPVCCGMGELHILWKKKEQNDK